MFITCHSVRWIPNLYELQQKEVGTVSGRVWSQSRQRVYLQEDLSWPPWIQHTTHLSNLLLVVSTATSFYIYLLKHHARTETEAPRPQHLYLAGQHQHSYLVASVYISCRASNEGSRRFSPTRAFSWLKALNRAFTFKNLIRPYAKQTEKSQTPRSTYRSLMPV